MTIVNLNNNERGEYTPPDAEVNYKSLNLLNKKDVNLVRVAMKKRWDIKDKDKKALTESISTALHLEKNKLAPDAKLIIHLGRLLAELESQNQTDELAADKNKRLDEGQPTENIIYKVKLSDAN